MTVVLPAAWAALVVAAISRRRPPPRRVRALVGERRGSARSVSELRFVERLGARLLRLLRRPVDPFTARRLGTAVLAGLGAVALPAAVPAAALAGWCWPSLVSRRAERRRMGALASDVPDVVDLFVLAVGAGLTVPLAVATVARRAPGPLGTEFRRVEEEVALGRRLADALDDMPSRAGEPVRPLVAALVASERYGAPLGAGLERLADEVRRDRRRRAEEAARRIPVKLLFPLVGCVLPAFALLTVAPLVAGALRSLRL